MKFKDWLKETKITRHRAGKLMGINQQTLYNVERGKPITLKTAAMIVAYTEGQVWYTDLLPTRLRTKLSPKLLGLCEAGK